MNEEGVSNAAWLLAYLPVRVAWSHRPSPAKPSQALELEEREALLWPDLFRHLSWVCGFAPRPLCLSTRSLARLHYGTLQSPLSFDLSCWVSEWASFVALSVGLRFRVSRLWARCCLFTTGSITTDMYIFMYHLNDAKLGVKLRLNVKRCESSSSSQGLIYYYYYFFEYIYIYVTALSF